jgi:hypothetical protein
VYIEKWSALSVVRGDVWGNVSGVKRLSEVTETWDFIAVVIFIKSDVNLIATRTIEYVLAVRYVGLGHLYTWSKRIGIGSRLRHPPRACLMELLIACIIACYIVRSIDGFRR